MIGLSDTQATVLSAAAERPDGNVLPFPPALRGGAAAKVVAALLTRGLIREPPESSVPAETAFHAIWRNDEGGRPILLRNHRRWPRGDRRCETGAPERPGAGHTDSIAPAESLTTGNAEGPSVTPTGPLRAKAREGTKQAQVVAMLRRDEGATIAQIVAATGWRPHTVRGTLAEALKKRLGLTIGSEKPEDGERVYRVV